MAGTGTVAALSREVSESTKAGAEAASCHPLGEEVRRAASVVPFLDGSPDPWPVWLPGVSPCLTHNFLSWLILTLD